MSWYQYVRQMAGDDSAERIAAKVGVTGATVSRWQSRDPNPRDVAAFARVYGRPILEAMVEAGFLTPEDAGQAAADLDPRRLSNEALVSEVARRLGAVEAGSDPAHVSTSSRLKDAQAAARRRRQQDRVERP